MSLRAALYRRGRAAVPSVGPRGPSLPHPRPQSSRSGRLQSPARLVPGVRFQIRLPARARFGLCIKPHVLKTPQGSQPPLRLPKVGVTSRSGVPVERQE